jgi:DNA polymerase-1
MHREQIMVVDGNYLLTRCLMIPSIQLLATKDGIPTGGVMQFLKSMFSSARAVGPLDKTVVCFDGGSSKRRRKIYPGYRVREYRDELVIVPGKTAQHIPVEDLERMLPTIEDGMTYRDLLHNQIRKTKTFLTLMGIPSISFKEREADDVICRVIEVNPDADWTVLSDDKDFYQLLTGNVQICQAMYDKGKGRVVTPINFKAEYGFSVKRFLLYKALVGDASDRVPGVKGIGDARAKEIVAGVDKPSRRCVENFCNGHRLAAFKAVASMDNIEILKRNFQLFDMQKESFSKEELRLMNKVLSRNLPIQWKRLHDMVDELELNSLKGNLHRLVYGFRNK